MTPNNKRSVGPAEVDWQFRALLVQILFDNYAASRLFVSDVEHLADRCGVVLPTKRLADEKVRNEAFLATFRQGNPGAGPRPDRSIERDEPLLILASFNELSDPSYFSSGDDLEMLHCYVSLVVNFARRWGLTLVPEGVDAVHHLVMGRQYYGVRYNGPEFGREHGFMGTLPVAPEIEALHRFRAYTPAEWFPNDESRQSAEKRIAKEDAARRKAELDHIQHLYEAAGYSFTAAQPMLQRNVKWLFHRISDDKKSVEILAFDFEVSPQTVRNEVSKMKRIVCAQPDNGLQIFPI